MPRESSRGGGDRRADAPQQREATTRRARRAEHDVILALESDHDEFAGGPGPVAVPAGGVVALGDEQGILKAVLAPRHWKLILLRKIRDGAEIEDHERMKRVLAVHVQNSVVDDLNEPIAGEQRGNEQERRSLPRESRRPCHVGDEQRRRNNGIGPQQNSEPDQNKRQCPRGPMRTLPPIRDKIDDRGSEQPHGTEQDIAPDHCEEHESWRGEREQHNGDCRSDGAASDC